MTDLAQNRFSDEAFMTVAPTARWLHISDLHFQADPKFDSDVVTGALLRSIPSLVNRFGKIDIVFVTGDIAYSGKVEEYERATEFFDNLLELLASNKSCLFVV